MAAPDLLLEPLAPLGARASGIDLRTPPGVEVAAELRAALYRHGLLHFPGQELTKDQLRAVATTFGSISEQGEAPGGFNMVSNVNKPGANEAGEWTLHNGNGSIAFHFDHCFHEKPLKAILLYGFEVPPAGAGGDTIFADMRMVTRLLPKELFARIQGMRIHHRAAKRAGNPEFVHPLVWRHHATGDPILYFSAYHAQRILDLDPDESAALLREFPAYIQRPEVSYRHVWQPKDLVIWDNLALQHARTDFDPAYRRHMLRFQIAF